MAIFGNNYEKNCTSSGQDLGNIRKKMIEFLHQSLRTKQVIGRLEV